MVCTYSVLTMGLCLGIGCADYCRALRAAGPYHDISEEGKFYAVVLEQTSSAPSQAPEIHMGTP